MPGLPVHHQLLEFTQLMSIESVMPSNHLVLCRPLLLPPSLLQLHPTLCDPMDCTPLFIGFSRQEYCSGLPCPPQGDLLNPGVEPMSPALQADSLPTEPATWEACVSTYHRATKQSLFPTERQQLCNHVQSDKVSLLLSLPKIEKYLLACRRQVNINSFQWI